jgi:WD40 repeat protein
MKPPSLPHLLFVLIALAGPPSLAQNVGPLVIVQEGLSPLVLAEPPPDPAALIGWLGNPRHRPQSHLGPVLFHPNGRQLLAREHGDNDTDYLSLWQAEPGSTKLALTGTFPLFKPWNLSGDGQFICGVPTTDWNRKGAFGVWKFPTGEPLWQIGKDHPAVINAAAFSQDGRVIALLWKVAENLHLSILDSASGKVIREIPMAPTLPISGRYPTTMVFSKDSLLLSPRLDEKGRLIEIPFADWTPRFHATTLDDDFHDPWESDTRLELSRDGKWLAVWASYRALVMESRSGKWTPKLQSDQEWCDFNDDTDYQTITITPDSKRILLSGEVDHRVVELATGKILSHVKGSCRCGVFHPAGRIFVRTCYPFEVNDASSLTPLPGGEVSGHTDAIENVDFTEDGKKLISTSERFAFVWDLSGESISTEPLSSLILPPQAIQGGLSRLAWLPSINEIQGADAFDFYRWKAPATGQTWPRTIVGELAFRGRENMRDMGLMMSVFPTPDGKSAIYHSNTGPFIVRTMDKDPAKITSRQLNFKSRDDMTGDFRYHFMPDSQTFIYDSYGGIARYDLTTDQITKVNRTESSQLAGHSIATGRIAGFSLGTLTLYDDKTLATISKTSFRHPSAAIHFKRADFSADGKWLACMAFDMVKGTEKLWLIDAVKLELAAVQLVTHRTSDHLRFSPDSQRLIVGHLGGSLSVWDVTKLVATAPASAEDKAIAGPPATARATASTTPKPTNAQPTMPSGFQTFTEVPAHPLLPDKVTPWVWSPDCSANAADGTLQIGTLKINGQTVEVLSTLGHTRTEWQTLSGKLEMQAQLPNGQTLLVSRDVFCDGSSTAYWADRLRNPTASIQQVEVSFEFGFSRDLTELEAGNRTPLSLDGTRVRLPQNEEFIVSHLSTPDGKRHTSHVRTMVVGTDGLQKPQTEPFFIPGPPEIVPPPSEPELHWDPERRVFQALYKITLAPYEHRILLHIARSAPIPESVTLNEYSKGLASLNVSTYKWFHPENIEIALNYATPKEIWMAKSSTNTLYKPLPEYTDQFGFTWRPAFNVYGLANQLMLQRGLHCHADGWPLVAFKGTREEGFNKHQASRQGDVCIAEKFSFSPTLGFRFESRIRYDGNAPRDVEINFVNLLRQPASQILDENGKSIPLNRNIPISTLGRKFAIVGKADDQPCALFSLGVISHQAAPELRFVDHQTMEIVYKLPMKPGEKIDLLHITAQQPLSAFPSPADMMAQWPPQ